MHGDEATTVLKRDMLGRVAYPRAQREALLDEFERSGLKGRPFAQVAGIKYQTFANWVQQRRRARGECAVTPRLEQPAASDQPAARPLRLVEAVLAQVIPTTEDTPVAAPLSLSGKDHNSGLEVLLPGSARMFVRDAGQAELAAQLLSHLHRSSMVTPC
jgi:hypothetical protein